MKLNTYKAAHRLARSSFEARAANGTNSPPWDKRRFRSSGPLVLVAWCCVCMLMEPMNSIAANVSTVGGCGPPVTNPFTALLLSMLHCIPLSLLRLATCGGSGVHKLYPRWLALIHSCAECACSSPQAARIKRTAYTTAPSILANATEPE